MKKNKTSYQITLGWLYPELMSTYGDRGNVLILQKRCEWTGVRLLVLPIDEKTTTSQINSVDAIFGGGAQDREQSIVIQDLVKKGKKDILIEKIEQNMPALFVCGAPQLMGKWYEPAEGERIEGVGIFDMETKHPGNDKPRLIGNIIAKIKWNHLHLEGVNLKHPRGVNETTPSETKQDFIVGFENHGGRTVLSKNVKPLAEVLVGHGNNGTDKTEGVVYKNAIGTYLHGPLLSKNPHIADWFIRKTLEVKYKEAISLTKLDDQLEYKAQSIIAKRLGVDI